MTTLKQFQIDAFAKRCFEGNPAAVVPLDSWISDALMQSVAAENNFSETAFFVKNNTGFDLRWFTPEHEVDLCGHATLAAAHVLFSHLGYDNDTVLFQTRSGELRVDKVGQEYRMNFPAQRPEPCEIPVRLVEGLGVRPREVLRAEDYIAVFDDESIIRDIRPNASALLQLDLRGVAVTAPSQKYDFVSRMFGPKVGIFEDPVTGSVHCALAPYWAERLRKTDLRARQISRRGGEIRCEITDDRVLLYGPAITFLTGEIYLP